VIDINKILINGRSLAGKDTIADYLVEKYGFTKISFATPIYELAERFFGMKIKNRFILQQIGQKFREIDPDVWVKYAFKEAEKYEKVVLVDVRQANEYIYGVNNGFIPLRVSADFDLRVQRAIERDGGYPDTSLWENDSETGADNFKYIELDNNGKKEDMYKILDQIVKAEFMAF